MDDQQTDRRVAHVTERLTDELVDADGNRPDPATVTRAVHAAAEPLTDAPVQEFTPLLIEHDARDALREEGFHRHLDDEADTAPRDDADGGASDLRLALDHPHVDDVASEDV